MVSLFARWYSLMLPFVLVERLGTVQHQTVIAAERDTTAGIGNRRVRRIGDIDVHDYLRG